MAVITGTSGNDTLDALNPGDILRGFQGNDVLNGTSGNEELDGGLGADTMNGGLGNDFYDVDNRGDVVNDPDKAVINTTVNFNLSNVTGGATDLTLNLRANGIRGTGTSGDDVIISYADNTIIVAGAGDDVLKGGFGSDLDGGDGNDSLENTSGNGLLRGGNGDDFYVINATGNILINESGSTGTDTIFSTVDFSLSGTAGVTFVSGTLIENLTLAAPGASLGLVGGPVFGEGNSLNNQIIGNRQNNTLNGLGGDDTIYGSFGDDTINGGNGNDSLFGEIGNDSLIGGAGADTLVGGVGDDIYEADGFDTIVELAGEGFDIVNVSGSLITNAEVEVINVTVNSSVTIDVSATSTGTAINILNTSTGNDILTGGAGNDTINGKAGIDILTGGAGADVFGFGGAGLIASGSTSTSIRTDRITDFTSGTDVISLDRATFTAFASAGAISAGDFATVTTNVGIGQNSALIVYNTVTGELYYNANGSVSGSGGGGFFADLGAGTGLTAGDIIIV